MKKLLALTLTMITMVFSLTACGGDTGKTPSDGTTASQQPNNTSAQDTQSGGEQNNTKTVEGILSLFGLKEDDIKADFITAIDLVNGGEKGGEIKLTVNSTSFIADYNTWGENLFNKTVSLSKDGKVYDSMGKDYGEEVTAFVPAKEGKVSTFAWTYYLEKSSVLVTLSPGVEGNTFTMMISK